MNEGAIDIITGIAALVVAGFLVRRVGAALRDGVIPMYKTRLTRAQVGEAKFRTLVALNGVGALVMLAIGLDLLLGLGLREAF